MDTPHPSDHRFYNLMSVLISAVILAGFSRTYGPKLAGVGAPAYIHFHAALFAGWLVLYVTQTTLVRVGRVGMHRQLGITAMVWAAAMGVVGTRTAIIITREGHRGIEGLQFADPATFLLINVVAIGVFAILITAGFFFRGRPQTHKRLMLMANVSLMPPGVARLFTGNTPLVFGLVLAFLLAGPIYDRVTKRRLHPAYLFGVLLILLPAPPVLSMLGATSAWQQLAAWMIS